MDVACLSKCMIKNIFFLFQKALIKISIKDEGVVVQARQR